MEDKFTKANFLRISQDALDFQLETLYPVQTRKEVERVNIVFLNHDRNFSTFLTIKNLVEHGRVADIYTLSRSMFESIISMGLLAKRLIENDIERYQDFQYLEIHKTYNHLKRLGLERLSGVLSSEVELLCSKRGEYIKNWGNKTASWSGKTLEQNVRLVDSNYAPTCNEKRFYEYLYCQVYRKGSQSAHSSFAGLSKGVDIERFLIPGVGIAQRFKENEAHLIFSCFHSLIVFLSSVRFLGHLMDKKETEEYFHDIAEYVISRY